MTHAPSTSSTDPARTASAPSLARVAKGDLCAGCGACAAIAPGKIRMIEAAPGYLRPTQTQPLSTAEDATIADICPGLGQKVAAQGRTDHPLWGPHVAMMTGHATDADMRHMGSSGGALSALLHHMVQEGVVDAVVQVAADPARAVGNATFVNNTRAQIMAAAGSRYAPSAPLAQVQDHLAQHDATGRRFAFVGKPCDAAALAAWRAGDARVAAAFPIIASFFCAGVPSHAGVQALLQAMGTSEEDTARFRYRGNGWPGFATAVDHAGETRQMSYHNSWGNVLSKHVQHRCKICADGTGLAADIVCADAWESDAAGYPVFTDAPGTSLIVARSDVGMQLIDGARAAGRIETSPFDLAALAAIQPGQRERRRGLLARLAALRIAGRPVPHYQGLKIRAAARQNPIKKNVKNFAGMLRRTLRK